MVRKFSCLGKVLQIFPGEIYGCRPRSEDANFAAYCESEHQRLPPPPPHSPAPHIAFAIVRL